MKKIFLLGILLFLTGCSIDYDVTINNNGIEEVVTLNEYDNYTFPTTAFIDEQGSSEEPVEIEGLHYYNINSNDIKTVLKYNFTSSNYSRSRAANTCLKSFNLSNTQDNYQLLNTSNYFSCLDLYPAIDTINIRVHIDSIYEVVSNNADSENSNVYSWVIDKNNYQNKNIELVYRRKVQNEEVKPNPSQELEKDKNSVLDYILLGSLLFLFVIGIIALIKYKSINRYG